MSDPSSSCMFDLLDAAMRDPFLQQAFRQLDQRHLYGIVPMVCRSWHHLSTTSSSSLTVEISTELNKETGEPDAAISFSEWLGCNIEHLTRLDLTFGMPSLGVSEPPKYEAAGMLLTITGATQLCSLRLNRFPYMSHCFPYQTIANGPVFAGFSALTTLTSFALHSCSLSRPAFSSVLAALTQLRELDLKDVRVLADDEDEYEDEDEEEDIMQVLTSSLVNLRSLTLNNFNGLPTLLPTLNRNHNLSTLVCVEDGLVCIRSLPKLVHLDIRGTLVPSGKLVDFTRGLPVTGVTISLHDPGHVLEVAGWLERCVPTTLRYLELYMPGNFERFSRTFELQPSQVSRLLAPLGAAGGQLQALKLRGFDLSQGDSVNSITRLTHLTSLSLYDCKFHEDGWALLQQAFADILVHNRERVRGWYDGTSHAKAVFLGQTV